MQKSLNAEQLGDLWYRKIKMFDKIDPNAWSIKQIN